MAHAWRPSRDCTVPVLHAFPGLGAVGKAPPQNTGWAQVRALVRAVAAAAGLELEDSAAFAFGVRRYLAKVHASYRT
eukprot:6175742-Pyramimonas_sp.AAC.1